MNYEPQYHKLRIWNLCMGFLHLAQGIIIIILTNKFSLMITTSFLTRVQASFWPETKVLVNVQLGYLVAVFLFISAVAHFNLAAPWGFGWYVNNLKKGINYARWYEYALSASLMVVIIAMLCGVYDLGSLIMAFVLIGVMNLCGLVMEVHNQTTQRTNWTSFWVGCIAGIAPWIVMAIYFFGSLANANESVPKFVYFILPILFVFFFCFAVNMFLQYKRVGPWRDYLFGERVYILLSLIAKSALAWQVFAGTLRPV